MPRLFVAVWPPAEVIATLAALARPEQVGVRHTRADQWHVTLRFLGETDVETAASALAGVRAAPAVAELGPVVCRLGDSVVVAPVAGLDALAQAVAVATEGVGDPPESRPFVGHLTLARVREGARCALEGVAVGGAFPVPEISLVETERRPQGVGYRIRKTHPVG